MFIYILIYRRIDIIDIDFQLNLFRLKKFGPFALGVVRNYTRQILFGLQYLHDNGIIHRDIKGGNILVDDVGTVKLADFGASAKLSQFNKTQETTTVKGTPYFMAPEVLAESRYGRKGDIWAVGCTMIQMLSGDPPWKDRNLKGLIQLHTLLQSWNKGPPSFKPSCPISKECQECLEICFRKKETERPTPSQLLQCDFLIDEDDLEDSLNKDDADRLEDSGVMNQLKQDMDRAISISKSSFQPLPASHRGGDSNTSNTNSCSNSNNNSSRVEDTVVGIERRIQNRHRPFTADNSPNCLDNSEDTMVSKNQNRSRRPYTADNSPYPAADNSPSIGTSPYSQNNSFSGPKFSRDIPLPPPSSSNNKNPFSKGIVSVKSFDPTESDNRQRNPIDSPPIPVVNKLQEQPGDSLKTLKSKTSANRLATLNIKSQPQQYLHQEMSKRNGANQSSNRDSEDVTPLPPPSDDEEEEEELIVCKTTELTSNRRNTGINSRPNNIDRSKTQAVKSSSPFTQRQPVPSISSSASNSSSNYCPPGSSSKEWICLKCRAANTDPFACDICATRKGARGTGGLDIVIRRDFS